MQPKAGVFVCMGCGAEADLRNEDGSRAVFARAARPGSGRLAILVGVLILVLAAGAAGWAALRFGWPGLPAPAPVAGAPAAAPPEMRTEIAAAFDPVLREGLIASFGTPDDDAVLGAAVLADARIAVLVRSRSILPAAGDALHLVFLDGGETLTSKRLATRGEAASASLAAGPDGLLLALIADADGLRLDGLDPSGMPLWQHTWPETDLQAGAPVLLADPWSIAVTAPGAAPGTLMAAMLTADGRLAWQRSFETSLAPEAAAALDAGDLLLTFPVSDASGETRRRLVRLSLAGETLGDTQLEGRLVRVAGLVPGPGGGARVLAAVPVPAVSAYSAGGARLWETRTLGALLHDRIFLMPEADGGARVLSAFRLSDVQTDVFLADIDASGGLVADIAVVLPPGAEIGAALAIGGGGVLVAGQLAATGQAGRDGFVLSLAGAGAGPSSPVTVDAAAAPGPASVPAQGPAPGPAPGPASGPEAAPTGGDGAVTCTFGCLAGGRPFSVEQRVVAAEASGEAGLRGIQAIVCRASGGAQDPQAAPACRPPG